MGSREICGACWQSTDKPQLSSLVDVHGHQWWICAGCVDFLWAARRPAMSEEEDRETEITDAERRIAEAVIKGLGKMLGEKNGES